MLVKPRPRRDVLRGSSHGLDLLGACNCWPDAATEHQKGYEENESPPRGDKSLCLHLFLRDGPNPRTIGICDVVCRTDAGNVSYSFCASAPRRFSSRDRGSASQHTEKVNELPPESPCPANEVDSFRARFIESDQRPSRI